jgi:hypothetical protein
MLKAFVAPGQEPGAMIVILFELFICSDFNSSLRMDFVDLGLAF